MKKKYKVFEVILEAKTKKEADVIVRELIEVVQKHEERHLIHTSDLEDNDERIGMFW